MPLAADLRRWLILVPARLGSERLPRKPLADLGGRPMVVRVAENLGPLVRLGAKLIVATDSAEVITACTAYGIDAVMTKAEHESGTDRCAEVAASLPHDYVLNVQGDEPFVNVDDLLALTKALVERPEAAMATLAHASDDRTAARDPNVVKAVRADNGYALYFSRLPVPYDRSAKDRQHLPLTFWHHIGVYAFRRDRLAAFVQLTPSPLERTEKLEQLRALEAGWRLYIEPAGAALRGIDTAEDLEAARARF